jgi:hypothetical protein
VVCAGEERASGFAVAVPVMGDAQMESDNFAWST